MRIPYGAVIASITAYLVSLAPAEADAPAPPALPIATDLSKVAVGSWAEYAVTGAGLSSTVRWAVVGRDGEGTTLEVSIPDSEIGGGKRARVVQRITVPGATVPAVRRTAIQVGDGDPLALPATPAAALAQVDPARKLAHEDVRVRAGSFAATRHRQVTAQGTLDYWAAVGAGPLGIVKLTLSFPSTMKVVKKRASGAITMELAGVGGDARPAMVKAPVALGPPALAATRARLGIRPVVAPAPGAGVAPVVPAPRKEAP